ncbi:MAG: hypothetical protein M3Y21_04850 [Candidatus Eremiobacteraeota bacterium]|nr:hypothetical protein [Candidatus Eremiobacteraeota bacterium]
MKKFLRVFLSAAGLFAMSATAAGADTPTPIRHLVYNFTYALISNLQISSSGISTSKSDGSMGSTAPASGVSNYTGGNADKGTITADVLQATPDGGLVVNISEQAESTRKAPVVKAAIYGDGRVFYDTSQTMNEEELELLRTLGRNFVDTSRLDAKNHWQITGSGPDLSVVADYTVKSSANGIANIDIQRVVKMTGAQAQNTTTDGSIVYNLADSMPTVIHEESMQRRQQQMDQYNTIQTHIDLTLSSDSLTAAKKQAGAGSSHS